MLDTVDGEPDLATAYEALIEFLYLAPVGIIKFRPDGAIDMANPTAAQLLMPLALDGDMSDLFWLLAPIAPDLKLHVQRFQEPAGPIFSEMQLVVPSTGNTLMLDINKINNTTLMAVIQNVSDLTESRREVERRTTSQRLLASVFMRLSTPVVVNRADGLIVLTNHAFQKLMGYDSKSLDGLNIDALLPPDAQGAARAARTQQMLDGKTYEVDVEVLGKSGSRFHVGLHFALLDESDAKHLRVVTLVPRVKSQAGELSVSQVKTISLSPFITEIGGEWSMISARAMMLVEEAIKTLLGHADVVKRGKDNSFVIWFSSGEPARNSTVMARAEQAVRRVFVTEFGTKIANRVIAMVAA